MKNQKPLTAQDLLDFLISTGEFHDLSEITICYRDDRDSDVAIVCSVEDDLYDEEDNSTLTSIMLLNNSEEI
jgi:hypothetical protein